MCIRDRGKQSKDSLSKSGGVAKEERQYKTGDLVYALHNGPHHDKHPRWVPAIVKKSVGQRCFNVKISHGPVWRRHWEQLRPRYTSGKDYELSDHTRDSESQVDQLTTLENDKHSESLNGSSCLPRYTLPVAEYGPGKPRRSSRKRKPKDSYEH